MMYPYKKRKFGHRLTGKKGEVKTKRDDHLQTKGRGVRQTLHSWPLEETHPDNTLISDF
jgi:hypothetical protein